MIASLSSYQHCHTTAITIATSCKISCWAHFVTPWKKFCWGRATFRAVWVWGALQCLTLLRFPSAGHWTTLTNQIAIVQPLVTWYLQESVAKSICTLFSYASSYTLHTRQRVSGWVVVSTSVASRLASLFSLIYLNTFFSLEKFM